LSYLQKIEEQAKKLKRLIEEKIIHDKLESEITTARSPDFNPRGISSGKMHEISRLIHKVAATPSTVLITGESGTGKEVTAKQIHKISPGDNFPFIAVNLGGMPETLIESELFGYERGAFTGAAARKPGMFELAASGTIFLDEIGDMPMHLQVKLLRVLQDKKVQRLGGTQPIPINTRIIAATNKNLEKLVKTEKFREDLYYRLNVFRINLPPLRERMEDLPDLISYFIDKFNSVMSNQITGIDEEALDILKHYSFPGNIRELENIIERAFILSDDKIIRPGDLGLSGNIDQEKSLNNKITGKKKHTKLRDLEKEAIEEALHKWEGNRTKAAEELGITRRTLFNKIKEYKIEENT
ncbi:MAG: sigma-54-dependent Fis family transcriptional regulator, partial [Spirochaetes bacterium]